MGSMPAGLSNVDIHRIVNRLSGRYPDIMSNFQGVFPADQISSFLPRPNNTCIINLSRTYERGSHFVAMAIKNNELVYFDPLGLDIFQPDLLAFVLNHPLNLMYIQQQIQPLDSHLCGLYCMLFCFTNHFLNVSEFIEFFSKTDLNINDIYVIELLCKFITHDQ